MKNHLASGRKWTQVPYQLLSSSDTIRVRGSGPPGWAWGEEPFRPLPDSCPTLPFTSSAPRMQKRRSPGHHFLLRTRFFLMMLAARSPGPLLQQQS